MYNVSIVLFALYSNKVILKKKKQKQKQKKNKTKKKKIKGHLSSYAMFIKINEPFAVLSDFLSFLRGGRLFNIFRLKGTLI